MIASVNPTEVQWRGLSLGEPPCRSRSPLCQVSMPWSCHVWLLCHSHSNPKWCVSNLPLLVLVDKDIPRFACFKNRQDMQLYHSTTYLWENIIELFSIHKLHYISVKLIYCRRLYFRGGGPSFCGKCILATLLRWKSFGKGVSLV